MGEDLTRLQPRSLWEHFTGLARIPRPSKHEGEAVAWVRELAARHRFDIRADKVGNLFVDVPATDGRGAAPTIILQGHLDMVCEKNKGVEHDFLRDPIRLRVDGEWVRAEGTTLGADNGIGVAAALACATDPGVKHGPLQLLLTIDEETGLTGAKDLDGSMLKGKTLVNLDSEEDGVLFVGCAGGSDTYLFLSPAREAAPADGALLTLEVSGLKGGHSGLNIHENRGNALKLAARVLWMARASGVPFRLIGIEGGSKHNAIPREAGARLSVARADVERLRGIVACMTEAFRTELDGIDDGFQVSLSASSGSGAKAFADSDRDRLIDLLIAIPHGVLGMSPAIPGLVETSNNLAVVGLEGDRVRVVTSSRSSVMPTLRATASTIDAIGRLARAEVETHDGYPGWKPNLKSPVLEVVRDVYRGKWGREPRVTAIHAGLECGLLGVKRPDLDMISFGPQIEGAHSPDERVSVPSVERFWNALTAVLEKLS